jgi:hypothetical protein
MEENSNIEETCGSPVEPAEPVEPAICEAKPDPMELLKTNDIFIKVCRTLDRSKNKQPILVIEDFERSRHHLEITEEEKNLFNNFSFRDSNDEYDNVAELWFKDTVLVDEYNKLTKQNDTKQ